MKHILKILSILLLIGQVTMSQDIQEIISQIREAEVPDKRLAIFNVKGELIDQKIVLTGEVSESRLKEKLLEAIKSKFTAEIDDRLKVLPSEDLGNKTYAVVKLSVCNIRSKPEHFAELSTQSTMGTPLKVYKKQGGWYLIQMPDLYFGWVDSDGLQLMTKEELMNWNNSQKIIFTDLFGLVYSNKDLKESISDAVATNLMLLEGEVKGLYKVKLPDGRIGFVKKDQAVRFGDWEKRFTFSPKSVIDFGRKFLGFPYLWGGTSIKGIDCSGFMRTIFLMNGLILPRDADQQSKVGVEIPFDEELTNLKEGDLIFFGKKADESGPERVTHVGIYIGEKLLLHSSGRVKIDSFDKNHSSFNEELFNKIVRIRRIFGQSEIIDQLKLTNNKFYKSNEQ